MSSNRRKPQPNLSKPSEGGSFKAQKKPSESTNPVGGLNITAERELGTVGGIKATGKLNVGVDNLIGQQGIDIEIDATNRTAGFGAGIGSTKGKLGVNIGGKVGYDEEGNISIKGAEAGINIGGFGGSASIDEDEGIKGSISVAGAKIEIGVRPDGKKTVSLCYGVPGGELCVTFEPDEEIEPPTPPPPPPPPLPPNVPTPPVPFNPKGLEVEVNCNTGKYLLAGYTRDPYSTSILRLLEEVIKLDRKEWVRLANHYDGTGKEDWFARDEASAASFFHGYGNKSLPNYTPGEGKKGEEHRDYYVVIHDGESFYGIGYWCWQPNEATSLSARQPPNFPVATVRKTWKYREYRYAYEVRNHIYAGHRPGCDYDIQLELWDLKPPPACPSGQPKPPPPKPPPPITNLRLPNYPQHFKRMNCNCCNEVKEIHKYLGIAKLKRNKFPVSNAFLVPGGSGNDNCFDYYSIMQALFRMLANGLIINPKSKPLGSEWQNVNATAWASAMYEMMAESMSDGNSTQRFEVAAIMQLTQMMATLAENGRKIEFVADAIGLEPLPVPEDVPVCFTIYEGHKGFGKKEPKKIDTSKLKTDDDVEKVLGKMLNPSLIPITAWKFKPGQISINEALRNNG